MSSHRSPSLTRSVVRLSEELRRSSAMFAELFGSPPKEEEPAEPEVPPKKEKKKKLTKEEKKALAEERERAKLPVDRQVVLSAEYQEKFDAAMTELYDTEAMREMGIELSELTDRFTGWSCLTDDKIERLKECSADIRELLRRSHAKRVAMFKQLKKSFKALQTAAKVAHATQAEILWMDFVEFEKAMESFGQRFVLENEQLRAAINALIGKGLARDYKKFLDKYYNIVGAEIEERYEKRDKVISKIKDLRKTFDGFLNLLGSVEEEKFAALKAMLTRSIESTNEAATLNHTEMIYLTEINTLTRDESRLNTTFEKHMHDLYLEELQYMHHRSVVIGRLNNADGMVTLNMKTCTRKAFDEKRKLGALAKKGNLMLALISKARRLEKFEEKLVEYGTFDCDRGDRSPDNQFSFNTVDLQHEFDISEEDLQESFAFLNNFWRRMNIVRAQNKLLESEKAALSREKAQLQQRIKKYTKADQPEELRTALTVTHFEAPVKRCGRVRFNKK